MRGVLLLLCGCNALLGVHEFDAPDAGFRPLPDGPAARSCLARWQDGTVKFGDPEALPISAADATASANDRDPSLSADGRTLFFSSNRGGNGYDVWAWTVDGGDAPVLQAALSSPSDDTKATLRGDALQVIVARSGGNPDLYQASRDAPTSAFGPFSTMQLASVDTGLAEYDPQLVGAGLVLYFSRGDNDGQHIYRASRTALDGAFTDETRPVPGTGADPWVSDDEQLIVYSQVPAGGMTDLYYLTTKTSGAITDLDTAAAEGDPFLTADACTIYFASNRAGGPLQLFRATMTE